MMLMITAKMMIVNSDYFRQADPEYQIVLEVDKRNFMDHSNCSPYPTTVCLDYLEVKYNVSFGYTGARSEI